MNSFNILVIDDDEDISEMLRMMLEFKGNSVQVSNTAENVTSLLANGTTDLIILDMLIANSNGLDVCHSLKTNHEFSNIPVLMFSAMPDGREKALQAGADDFIAKPFTMNDILEKINRFKLPPYTSAI